MKNYLILSTLAATTLFSCGIFTHTEKNSTDNSLWTGMQLDTVNVSAKAPEPLKYEAAATRLSDIIHTKLDVRFDWQKQYMYGKATITVRPYFYPASTLVLDARGMEIKEVDLVVDKNKTPLTYKYENNTLTINLNKEYKATENYTVFIDYVSKPNELKSGGSAAITDDKGLYFINPDGSEKNKPQQIWTQGETQASSVWFPTIDRPNERMTQEIYITVDKKYVTLSNGELASSFDNGDGTRTDYWKMDLPHAPYLAMMAIGEFAVVKDNKWRGKEVNYYVEKEYEPHAKAIFGNTPEMLEFYSNKLGVEYAWNKYSQVVARDYVSGAMENTTATLHGEFLQRTDRELLDHDNESIVAHELFHQWFGDLVTCESWSNLPLNESFATYGEYLWEEYKYGRDAADLHSAQSRAGYFAEASRKQVNLIRFYYDDKEDMFDGHSYNKGGQVLHMLRTYVGDDAFFASLKLYLEKNKFTSVEIHQLRLAFEEVTGEDLNWFFNQWFLSSGHPDLVIRTEYDAANKKQLVKIKQVQDFTKTPLFELPMAIDIYSNGKVERHKVVVKKQEEVFEFDAAVKPQLVNVDATKSTLCTKNEVKTIDELVFQYKNAPLYLDRFEALSQLASKASDSLATMVIISALNDKFWSLRNDAIEMLKNVRSGHEKEIKEKLVNIAQKDEKAIVRAAAIDFLAENYKDEDLLALYKNGLNDRSYGVLGSSLIAIGKVNPKEAMDLAKKYETEKSNDVLYAVGDLYSSYGDDSNNAFFLNNADKFSGFSKIGFISQYAAFLKNNKKDATIDSGADLLYSIAKEKGISKWVSYYAKKSIKELAGIYEDKEQKASQKLKDLKAANPNAGGTQELQSEIDNAQKQKQKLMDMYNTIN